MLVLVSFNNEIHMFKVLVGRKNIFVDITKIKCVGSVLLWAPYYCLICIIFFVKSIGLVPTWAHFCHFFPFI